MEISNYGVTLRRLTEDKIEMVRKWRNDPKIQQYMEFRDYITPEMQKKWFERINNDNNYYFIIVYEGKVMGLINLKDIDYVNKTAESGIFIYNDEFHDLRVSYRASLCQRDFAFDTLKLDKLYAHILNDNIRSIKYNAKFGFVLEKNPNCVYNQKYVLTKEAYYKNKEIIVNFLMRSDVVF